MRHDRLFGALFEIRDNVGAILRVVEMEKHSYAWDERLRVGQPLVERLLVPDDIGGFERVGIAVIRQRPRLAPVNAAMVGKISSMVANEYETCPLGILPGHLAMNGSRRPPS